MNRFIDYVDAINSIEDKNVTTEKLLNDFQYYYNLLRLTTDTELRINYRRYWRELISNNANAINLNNNEYSAMLNNRAKPLLFSSLISLYEKLTSEE